MSDPTEQPPSWPSGAAARPAAGSPTSGPEAPAPAASGAVAAPASADRPALSDADIEERIVEALQTVYDPEIPVNIYELGLIYDIDVQDAGRVEVKMTLTSPACPVAGSLPGEVRDKILGVEGVTSAEVEVVWDPVWNPSMMSEAAKLQLGMF